jgi:hypothetical protein
MSVTPYPLPREARQSSVLLGTGAATYGPFSFKIFDKEDVGVWMRAAGSEESWLPQTVTVNKVANLPFDMFTVTFAAGIGVDREFVVLGSRTPERTAGVLNGTRIDPNAVELEFSKIAAAFQELRRDVMGLNPVVGASDVTMGYALDRTNHTGTQPSETISDLPVGVAHAVHGVDGKELLGADEIGILDSSSDWELRKTTLGKLLSWLLPQISKGRVEDLILSNSTSNPANAINISPGFARGNGKSFVLSTALGKRLDQTWVPGGTTAVPVGGLDAGAKVAGETYHAHSIVNNINSALCDVLFSLSATAPVVPEGWTRVQRLGPVLVDSSGNIRPFIQTGNDFYFNTAIGSLPNDLSTTVSRSKSLLTCLLPKGVRVKAYFQLSLNTDNGDRGTTILIADGVNANIEQTATIYASSGVKTLNLLAEEYSNVASQVYARLDVTGTSLQASILKTRGWCDYQIPRGM